MTVKTTVLSTARHLESWGSTEPRIEAELLVMHLLGIDREHLYAHWNTSTLSSIQEHTLQALTCRRLKKEPLAYILGHREFFGLSFQVNDHVLIPRPETELLVEEALQLSSILSTDGPLNIADIGTGSGAIAIALAHSLPSAHLWATDISKAALAVATENRERHKLSDRIHLLHGDLVDPLPYPMSIIISNPPYIPSESIATLQEEVQQEPRIALDGGRHGLEVLLRLLNQATRHLLIPGVLLVEFDPLQATVVTNEARRIFPHAKISTSSDLAGNKRMLAVQQGM